MDWLTAWPWSPYAAGAGIGVLSWLTFAVSGHPLGCSTSFARTAGMIEKLFRGRKVEEKLFYREIPPVVDWQWMLVAGMVLGAFLSASLSGDLRLQRIPPRWEAAFGGDCLTRIGVSVAGGILLGFGSRWAGGCTSGHGISGTMQLALSSWVSACCFFIGGIATAYVLFGLPG